MVHRVEMKKSKEDEEDKKDKEEGQTAKSRLRGGF